MPANVKTIETINGPVSVERIRTGVFRIRAKGAKFFGQVEHTPSNNWIGTYRDGVSGGVLRHAGIWPQQLDATREMGEIIAGGKL